MSTLEIIIIGISLSMDAFAVAICMGLFTRKNIIIGMYFGFFQALMPLLGYFVGSYFTYKIEMYDHWFVFIMLSYIGIKMIIESNEINYSNNTKIKTMIPLSIATSIDAFAVGIAFSFLKVNIYFSSITIGIITFIICSIGVKIGNYFGIRYKKLAEILGGLVLIILGIKTLIEHLFLK